MTNKNINTNGYNFIDLELPSGTLWATANVGASEPTESGLYFQWGEVQGFKADEVGEANGKKYFGWEDYKWNIDSGKYATYGSMLELKDDAAHVHMGGEWHIPTPEQVKELVDNTTSKWKRLNGVRGRLFTSKKDKTKSIFIPSAGYMGLGALKGKGSLGEIWTSKVGSYLSCTAETLDFGRGHVIQQAFYRSAGLLVRGVIG